MTETQLTSGARGHTLNGTQVFSKDGKWIVYDTRNDDTKIGSTGSIEIVNVETKEIKVVYTTANQSEYGPGVGAATFSPVADRVLFIHGIRNADKLKPYSMSRRTGVAVDISNPQQPVFMDARDITPPFTPGALRGGTHAHSWSTDGKWVSFTYNDYVMEQLAKLDSSVKDLRMVGVMVPGRVDIGNDTSRESNSGEMFAMVVTGVTELPKPGSDEIERAFDECWIGSDGYIKPDRSRQRRAIAFQGNVRNHAGEIITEVFVADLPETLPGGDQTRLLQGTLFTRPVTPLGCVQRRVTYTLHGVQGPRHWLRSTPKGDLICFLAKDRKDVIQIFGVSPNGGHIRQITHNAFSVQGQFNFSPDGSLLAYPADNSVFITNVYTGVTSRITAAFSDVEKPAGAPNWSPDGKIIAYNRYINTGAGNFLQIFLLRLIPI